MRINKLFNPAGTDPYGVVFEGNTTGLCQLNNVARPWAIKLYDQMRSNFWVPNKIDLTQDVVDYKNLTEDEQTAYNKILGFLVFLDSIQVNNILNIKSPISAPEIGICLAEQMSQEALHSASYQYIVETILPKSERDSVYELWRVDEILKKRCESIASAYQNYVDENTLTHYLMALVADYILEGLYFYCGFMFFYSLATRSLMPGTADIIKLIHRDELSHVRLYQNLIVEAKNQYPNVDWKSSLTTMMAQARNDEINWNDHVCGDTILGISHKSTVEYVGYLANTRLKAVGEGNNIVYNNPYQHLERFADLEDKASTKTNFFEGTPSYTINSLTNWDF